MTDKIAIPKLNVSLPTNILIIAIINIPIIAINKYVPSLVKSILVKYPNNENTNIINAVAKKT